MLIHWLRSLFRHPYNAPGDGPLCPHCKQPTERVVVGTYSRKCFCPRCRQYYALEK